MVFWLSCLCSGFESQADKLFTEATSETKQTAKFRKKNSSAISLLWSSVSTEFEGILLNNRTSFLDCWEALGSTCGKNSIIKLSRTLHQLINLCYNPGSLLENHIDEFQKLHANYQSLTLSTTTSMQLTSAMAAVFFLHSLDNDNELSSLCQALYDLKPFNLNAITDCVAVEHTHRQSEGATILMAAKSKKEDAKDPQGQENQPKGHKRKENKEKKPTFQFKGQHSNSHDSNRRLENLEKMMENIH
ncbi:hypothetical protein O181_133486 [Austropuccinia psidii MF-1]|uniref:Uncharacterized protein n=1 Tax=Austropuccinia psidii MF-1 TaxID=1389203 RepID=A0A9Q3L7Z7_9BASI|nr:hypothetical protein [Austropuccinia psidii MF-1]